MVRIVKCIFTSYVCDKKKLENIRDDDENNLITTTKQSSPSSSLRFATHLFQICLVWYYQQQDDQLGSLFDYHHAASSNQLKFYTSGIDVRRAIVELLTSDVRPIKAYQRSKAKQNDICHFRFGELDGIKQYVHVTVIHLHQCKDRMTSVAADCQPWLWLQCGVWLVDFYWSVVYFSFLVGRMSKNWWRCVKVHVYIIEYRIVHHACTHRIYRI